MFELLFKNMYICKCITIAIKKYLANIYFKGLKDFMEKNIINISSAFYVEGGKLLVVKDGSGKWSLPPVKLVADENFDDALVRGIKNYFNISVTVLDEVGSIELPKGNDVYIVMFLYIKGEGNSISSPSFKEIKFVSFAELSSLDLIDTDELFVKKYLDNIKKYVG